MGSWSISAFQLVHLLAKTIYRRAGRCAIQQLTDFYAASSNGLEGGGQFDSERFDPNAVRFEDPKERWKIAFGRG
jgi:hypothetical protein